MKVSKFLSYILRHNPQKYVLKLDDRGFTDLNKVLNVLNDRFPNYNIDKRFIENLIKESDKKRFEINSNKIKACYGHSIDKKIKFSDASDIPEKLYHGTTDSAFKKIVKEGIKSKGRQYVHLSKDISTAKEVGKRRTPSPIILEIDAKNARNKGIKFYKSGDMILSDFIPSEYISKLE